MNRLRHPSEQEIRNSQREVLTSLEASGLDRKTTLVLGGSALALAGIRPTHDVDVMVPGSTYHEFMKTWQTPSGLLLRPKPFAHHPFLETVPMSKHTDVLPFDITHPHDQKHHRASPELDEKFLREIAPFPQVDGYRYLPPQLVAVQKEEMGRRKDRRDKKLIRERLQHQ